MKLKGVTIENCGEDATQVATGYQPEQIQTIYFAQETQGGGDDEMSDIDLTEEATGKKALSYTRTFCDTVKKFKVLGQIGLSKQSRSRSDFRSSLMRIYTVCHSIFIFQIHLLHCKTAISLLQRLWQFYRCPNFYNFNGC